VPKTHEAIAITAIRNFTMVHVNDEFDLKDSARKAMRYFIVH